VSDRSIDRSIDDELVARRDSKILHSVVYQQDVLAIGDVFSAFIQFHFFVQAPLWRDKTSSSDPI
jgi:hypothetical protein|tara:strand:+ start:1822 stop:2016 length:195 start_codon:yes stop_codon:yes gene_type:complete